MSLPAPRRTGAIKVHSMRQQRRMMGRGCVMEDGFGPVRYSATPEARALRVMLP